MRYRRVSILSQAHYLLLILFLTIVYENIRGVRFAAALNRRVHISDDLDDVIDEEEDEAWKEWGKQSTTSPEFDPPPSDLAAMDPSQIQAEMMKRQSGPLFGFVKLRFGVRRSPDMVAEIAMKWTKILRTGAIETKFMGVDSSTVMFTMEKRRDAEELKEFLLNQPEAYEIKIGDQVFRRPGDPPLEEVLETLHSKTNEADKEHLKEEL